MLSSKSLLYLSTSIYGEILKKLSVFFLLCLFFISSAFSPGNDIQNVDTNAKIKAVFIYNFTKYIEWPSTHKSDGFIIGILGESETLFKELTKMSKIRKVDNKSFIIESFDNVKDITYPHILFVPHEFTKYLYAVVNKLKGKSTLIISEDEGAINKGSTINFVVVGNRQNFEISKTNAKKHNLKIASTLENLAIKVN